MAVQRDNTEVSKYKIQKPVGEHILGITFFSFTVSFFYGYIFSLTTSNCVCIHNNTLTWTESEHHRYGYLLEWLRVGLSWIITHVRNVGLMEVGV